MFKRNFKYNLIFFVVFITSSLVANYLLHGSFDLLSWLSDLILFWAPAILVFKLLNRKNRKKDQERVDF